MKKICIIPARGGSKRIPKKNIKCFLGKPIIEYAIELAKSSGVFERIIVSTDSKEIAECALSVGAEVPFMRPAQLSDDFSGTQAVTAHALLQCSKIYKNEHFDYVCCIYPTSPLLTIGAIHEGLYLLKNSDCDFVVSATEYHFPIQRAIKKNKDEYFVPNDQQAMVMRSQDLQTMYHDAGQFYWGTLTAYIKDLPIWGGRTKAVVLPRTHVQDIDTFEDWQLAEMKYQRLNKNILA